MLAAFASRIPRDRMPARAAALLLSVVLGSLAVPGGPAGAETAEARIESLAAEAHALGQAGDWPAAVRRGREAARLAAETFGPRSAHAGAMRLALGVQLGFAGAHDEALKTLALAQQTLAAAEGPGSRAAADAAAWRASLLVSLDRADEAARLLEAALEEASTATAAAAATRLALLGALMEAAEAGGAVGQDLTGFASLTAAARGENSVEHAEAWHRVARLAWRAGRSDEAARGYAAELSVRERIAPDTLETASALANLAQARHALGETDGGIALMKRAVALHRALRPGDPELTWPVGNLANLLFDAGRQAEAIPPFEEAIAIALEVDEPDRERIAALRHRLGVSLAARREFDRALGALREAEATRAAMLGETADRTMETRSEIITVLWSLGRVAEATTLAERSLEGLDAADLGSTPAAAMMLDNLAALYGAVGESENALAAVERRADILAGLARNDPAGERADTDPRLAVVEQLLIQAEAQERSGRPVAAVPMRREILARVAAVHGGESREAETARADLADVLVQTGAFDEAERIMRELVARSTAKEGPEGAGVANLLYRFGWLYAVRGRTDLAVPLLERSMAILRARGEMDGEAGLAVRNALGTALRDTPRVAEAVAVLRGALDGVRTLYGEEAATTSTVMSNLALALALQDEPAEAEPERNSEAAWLLARALEIDEAVFGPVHVNVATALENHARVLRDGDARGVDAAVPLMRRAIAIDREVRGEGHHEVAAGLGLLADMEMQRGRAEAARPLYREATAIMRRPENRALLPDHRLLFSDAASALLDGSERGALEAFELVQNAAGGAAGGAIDAMSRRAAARRPALARLLRERQDLTARTSELDGAIVASLSAADPAQIETLRAARDAARTSLSALDARMEREFPDYEALSGEGVVDARSAARLLREGEALVLISPGRAGVGHVVPGTIHVVRRDFLGVAHLGPGESTLQDDMARLRCSFLHEPGCDAAGAPAGSLPPGMVAALASRGTFSPLSSETGGFDAGLAHDLWRRTIGRVAGDLEGVEHVIVVVDDDRLARLPWQVLLSEPLDDPGAPDALRRARFMVRDHAVSTLPSIAALRALRGSERTREEDRRRPFLGVGDPVIGRGGPMACEGDEAPLLLASARGAGGTTAALWHSGEGAGSGPSDAVADVEAVRALSRLPDTACELRRVRDSLGGGDLLLGEEATETAIRALDAADRLDDYRVLSFATHGLVAGEAGASEPALVLTPPAIGDASDDGLLTAGEVATLRLDADWVLLSACNTAAGDGRGESLSGLARAFFYAGARSLLVSHWPVSSPAAVRLTTGAFDARAADPTIGRSEALRRAILAILDDPAAAPHELDPAWWAPFAVVGEGL